MSSDEYFDELDSAFLQQVDAIEASHLKAEAAPRSPLRLHQARPPVTTRRTGPTPTVIEITGSDDPELIQLSDDEVEVIAQVRNGASRNRAPVAGPSRSFTRTTSRATIQTTLDGGVVAEAHKESASSKHPVQRHNSNGNNCFVGQPKKTKQWDHTAFAKTGWKKPHSAKGKERGSFEGEEEEEEDVPEEFEQFPAPFVSVGPPPPMKLQADLLTARRWIYPLNQPRRDYQFNIVKRCLFDNTLVALPTGLGKTFIAGVVMLNFYTWFPEGKVVFVAPTKPLVAQQIEACHKTCGIPGTHAAELTGQNPRAMRAKAWQEKRVFYMTPQTLMNDLKSDNRDPSDIVLLVIDEAHKGTGDYAYAQVIRYLMAKNPHFRVLALTATPGGKPEAVQAIVDALHISHIEIRDEQSLDLAPYLHKKHIKQHIIPMSEDIITIRDALSEVMTPMIQKLYNAKLLYGNPNPVSLHPFSCNRALSALHGARGGNQWAFSVLSKLGALARVMGYLIEGSLDLCYTSLQELSSGVNATTGKQTGGKSKTNQYQKDTKLQDVLQELEVQRGRPGGFSPHPKMEKLKALLIEHFAQKRFDKEDAQAAGGGADLSGDSRVMVFVSYRQCVDEVVAFLNNDKPLIRAVPFIGQGTDKNGKKGYGQKEQLDVIKRFKNGEFNVLVSTSIGEEGLDIGEIDMIVCYDAQKTPIRMLQRIGRTGRKREGYVHVLLSEDREERNWDRADDNYKDVQRFIIKAEHLELYDDVERLIPAHLKPECVEMVMEIEEYVREDAQAKKTPRSPSSKVAKRVRNDDMMRNIPTGASTTFVSVKDLLKKGTKKRKKVVEFDEFAGQDDSDDLEIAAGVTGIRRTVSMPAPSEKPTKKLRQSKTMPKPSGAARGSKGRKKESDEHEPVARDFDAAGRDDSDDESILHGVSIAPPSKAKPKTSFTRKTQTKPTLSVPPISPSPSLPATPPRPKLARRLPSIELSSSPPQTGSLRLSPRGPSLHQAELEQPDSPISPPGTAPASDGVVEPAAPRQRSSSVIFDWPPSLPRIPRKAENVMASPSRSHSNGLPSSPPAEAGEEGVNPDSSIAWLLDDDEELNLQVAGSSPLLQPIEDLPVTTVETASDTDIEVVGYTRALSSPELYGSSPVLSDMLNGIKPRQLGPKASVPRLGMPPPALPTRFGAPIKSSPSAPNVDNDDEMSPPALTFAVRRPGNQTKKKVQVELFDSSPLATVPPTKKRLHRQRSEEPDAVSSSPQLKRKKRKFADVVEAQKHNPWIDVEAGHSGDEMSAGGTEDEDGLSECDRGFIVDNTQTQASPSYNQTAVYRRSLMTQAPGGSMPAFAQRPVRRGGGVLPTHAESRRRILLSSSPPQEQNSDDYYHFGSFVVEDDAEISYADDSRLLSDL